MRIIFKFLFILGVGVTSTWADCWWTGCQPNNWATTGCANEGRVEKGREGCRDNHGADGFKYNCCTGGGGGQSLPASGGGGGQGSVSYEQFKKAVTSNGYPPPSQKHYNNFKSYARSLGKISSLRETAMALAQILHESGGFRFKREIICEHDQCPRSYRKPGCDAPGQYYFGRGYIQLTWCENYKAASRAIFGDENTLVSDPDRVARDDKLAWQTTFWYWGANVHYAKGVQQGQFGSSTNAINGEKECSRPNNQVAKKRFEIYGKVRRAFGLEGEGNPSGCVYKH